MEIRGQEQGERDVGTLLDGASTQVSRLWKNGWQSSSFPEYNSFTSWPCLYAPHLFSLSFSAAFTLELAISKQSTFTWSNVVTLPQLPWLLQVVVWYRRQTDSYAVIANMHITQQLHLEKYVCPQALASLGNKQLWRCSSPGFRQS